MSGLRQNFIEIYSWKDQQDRIKSRRTEWESWELSGEFMEWNTVERAIKTEIDTRTHSPPKKKKKKKERKESGQARLHKSHLHHVKLPCLGGKPAVTTLMPGYLLFHVERLVFLVDCTVWEELYKIHYSAISCTRFATFIVATWKDDSRHGVCGEYVSG